MKPSLLVVLTGPTAVGKTALSLQVARHFGTEILSADSRQLYREMRIGTAVPSPTELEQVKHHFIGNLSVHDYYNASRYEEEAIALLRELFRQHQVVVLCGGSMLYIDAVCYGIDDLPVVDAQIRNELTTLYETGGIEALRISMKKLDPEYYATVDLRNPKRLLRALEICIMTGKPYSALRTHTRKTRDFTILRIGLNCDRSLLYDRINRLVDAMVEAGLEEEARSLHPWKSLNALNTVGYREWFDYFEGITNRETTIEKIKSNTRLYARKQLTWFRKYSSMHWFDSADTGKVIPFIETQVLKTWGLPRQ